MLKLKGLNLSENIKRGGRGGRESHPPLVTPPRVAAVGNYYGRVMDTGRRSPGKNGEIFHSLENQTGEEMAKTEKGPASEKKSTA